MFGYDVRNSGADPQSTGPSGPIRGKWRFETGGRVQSSPAVADGVVYVTSRDRNVYALSTTDGTDRWRFQTGVAETDSEDTYPSDEPMVSSPAVVDDTVYVGGGNFTERASEGKIERLETHTHLYALDANTGELRWKFETDTTIQSAPAYVDGTVYVACNSGTVYALDADSGTERWRFTTPNANGRDIMSTPAVSDCRVYVGSWEEETLYSLDARDGSVDWQYQADDPVSASPAVHEGTVFAGVNGGGPLVALSADNGAVSWEYETGGSITGSSPAVADGTVFVGDHSYSGNRLHAVEAETGDEMWSTSTRGPIWASPAVADDVVYVADLEHTVYGFDTAEGTERWRFETGGDVRSSPAITGGMLFVGSEDGYVYALTDSGEATSESLK